MQSLSIEAMQEQINKIQEQLDEMKRTAKEEAKKQDVQYPPMLPGEGRYYLDTIFLTPENYDADFHALNQIQNVFPSENIANAYADAFRVTLS